MSKRRESLTRRCPVCAINLAMCFCNHIKAIPTKSKVSVILHIKEYFLTSNTGRIATLALENSEYFIRGKRNEPIEVDFTEGGKYEPYYLFPSEEAQILDEKFLNTLTKPVNLVVPDATWRQAKKFHKREESLKTLPHLKLASFPESIYELRKQKTDEGVCTMEAIAFALGQIESPDIEEHLMTLLKEMNERVMIARAKR